MKKVQGKLMLVFWLLLSGSAVLYLSCDVMNLDMPVLAGASQQERFVVTTVMILLTLALVPLSLRLFKFHRVATDLLSRKEKALCKWGMIRMITLGVLLFVNTMLYYFYGFEPSFGYLAVVVLLTMPFVYPSTSRCVAEIEPEPASEPDSEDEAEPIPGTNGEMEAGPDTYVESDKR